MPYQFTFKINNNIQFQAFLQTKRCICISKNGNRCGKRVVIGAPYCWIHLLYQKHLRVEESNIENAGLGLFALDKSEPDNAIIFRPGDKIITYDGQVINNDELVRRYTNQYTAPYSIKIKEDRYEDAALERGPGSLLNHANKSRSNCEFVVSRNNRDKSLNDLVFIRAIKNIRNHQELLVNYGNDYDFDVNTSNTTKYKR